MPGRILELTNRFEYTKLHETKYIHRQQEYTVFIVIEHTTCSDFIVRLSTTRSQRHWSRHPLTRTVPVQYKALWVSQGSFTTETISPRSDLRPHPTYLRGSFRTSHDDTSPMLTPHTRRLIHGELTPSIP